MTSMLRAIPGSASSLLLAAGVLTGCMTRVDDGQSDSSAALAARSDALAIVALPYDPEPPLTRIPSCWWIQGDEDCDAAPECRPDASSDTSTSSSTTLRSGSTTRTTSTRLGSVSSGTGSTGTANFTPALDIKAEDPCPSPNGVGTCSTCSRSVTSPWKASLELGLASRVLITNGLNATSFVVKDYPVLNAQAYGQEGSIPRIDVDLTQGTTLLKSGTVSYTQDLYMFFTGDFDAGPYPVGNWVFCPKNGSTCVELSD